MPSFLEECPTRWLLGRDRRPSSLQGLGTGTRMGRCCLVPKAWLCKPSFCLVCAVEWLVLIETHTQAGIIAMSSCRSRVWGKAPCQSPDLVSVLSGSILAAQRSDNGSYVCKLNISGTEVVSDPILVQLEGELEEG